ncbi:MAG: hypothetical protein V1761_01515 [bacterium]
MHSNIRFPKSKKTVRDITIAAMLLTVLFVQEELLTFLPNIQLTVLFIAVYAAVLPPTLLFPIVIGHVILDNLYMGSFSPLYTPAMLAAWLTWAAVAFSLRKSPGWQKVVAAGIFGFVYGLFYALAFAMQFGFQLFWPYLVSDLWFDVMMAVSGLVSIAILFQPLRSLLDALYHGAPDQYDA